MKFVGISVLLLVIFFPLVGRADFASSSGFIIERGVIDTGGGFSTSTNFNGRGSIGQPGTGISSSTSFVLKGGFLYFGDVAGGTSTATTTPTTTAPGGSTGVPGGGGEVFPSPPTPPLPEGVRSCDFNNDGRCNIVDLSILLYYYDREGSSISRYDLNENEKVDFPDVSVLMYFWTG